MKLSTGKAIDMKAIFGLLVLCFILFLDQNLVSAKKNHYLIETDGKGKVLTSSAPSSASAGLRWSLISILPHPPLPGKV